MRIRKNNTIKKILSLLLILSMTINLFTLTGSASEETGIAAEMIEKLNEHIEVTLPGYLKMNNLFGIKVTISEPMIITEFDDNSLGSESYICFVFNNDAIIGKITLAEYNGEIISSFDTGYLNEISEVYNLEIPVAFASYNDCLIMQSDSEPIVLYGYIEDEILDELTIEKNTTLISEVDFKTFKSAPASRNTIIQLNVPFTNNNSLNGGICWAACIASKVRFHFGNGINVNGYNLSTSSGALAIYDMLEYLYKAVPEGNDPWIQRGYDQFYVNVNITGSLTSTAVSNVLGQNKPIHIGMFNGNSGHSVIIRAVDYNSTGGYYSIMDPNYSYYISTYVNENALNNGNLFNYITPGGNIYTNWSRSRY